MFCFERFKCEKDVLYRVAVTPGTEQFKEAFKHLQKFVRDFKVTQEHENGWHTTLTPTQMAKFIETAPDTGM